MSLLSSMPFPMQFFVAFLVVLSLIAGTAWVVRRFGSSRIGSATARGRQPRLGVVDHASVDSRRRLLIIRRDNVEHLVMIGGPTDVVVEANIVRGASAARDASIVRSPAAEALPRAIPLPDAAGTGSWPLQPEPAAGGGASRAARSEPEDQSSWPLQSQPEAPARGNRDTLSALHDELSSRPAALPRGRPQTSQRSLPPEPRMSSAQPSVPEPGAAVDQSLAEMAHRLEAALRKPGAKPRSPLSAEGTPLDETGTTPPLAESSPPARGRGGDSKSQNAGKMLYDSLEQEMASLLGRPTGKA
jgi:flagellar protein FliO/FliZ